MLQVRLHRGQRNLRKHELGAAQLRRTSTAKGRPRKSAEAGLEALRLVSHALLQRRGPVAVNEIVAAIEHEKPGVVEISARPSRRMKRGAKTVARLDRRDETLLIGKHGLQPQFAEQRVARSEAVVERALGGVQPLGYEIDGHRRRPPLRGELAGCGKEAGMIESGPSHCCRLNGLDVSVNMR